MKPIPTLSTLIASTLIAFGSASSPALRLQLQSEAPSSEVSTLQKAVAPIAATQPALSVTQAREPSPLIVIGFLGGRVKKSNAIHREVQLARHLRQKYPAGVHVEVFQNAHGRQAFSEIQSLLDINRDGIISLAEKQHARIVIYGHSWGATQTVTLARRLEGQGIPVLLTILVDRVPKFGGGDDRIPANVAQAVNFYQLNGLLHGNATIRAEDPASTKILGNYQFDYSKAHIACDEYPWYARAFMGPHIEIENDPRVWNQVESLISSKLPPENATAAFIAPSR